jgi:tetratricopeptide (TPR) repeat protein
MEIIKNLVTNGDFLRAKREIERISQDSFRQMILELSYDERCIASYGFLCSLLIENETPEVHYLASEVMATAFCHLEGAYASALYHARRAAELSPDDTSYLEYLLLFHEIPEKLIDKEEAIQIAKKIIESDAENLAAKRVLGNRELN